MCGTGQSKVTTPEKNISQPAVEAPKQEQNPIRVNDVVLNQDKTANPQIEARLPEPVKEVSKITPKVDPQPPKVEITAPKVEPQPPKVEIPAPKVEIPAPKQVVTAPKVEIPAPKQVVTAPTVQTETIWKDPDFPQTEKSIIGSGKGGEPDKL